jgi:uncharacterized membrane protein (DUF106 family)
MSFINRLLGSVFDLLLLPFRTMPPAVGLTVISALVSVGMLIAFKRVSDQAALDRVKRRIAAGVYEIRLYKDDLRSIFASQLSILRHTGTYFRLSMVPMLWIMLPIVVIVIQLQFQYGYASLDPGESTIVSVELDEASVGAAGAEGEAIALEPPAGIRVETPTVWIPSLREASWRIVADAPGDHELVVRVGDQRVTKSLRVSGTTVRRSPLRPASLLGQIVYPAEPPLPRASGVESIRVAYADADVNLFGIEMHWIIAFFILTMVFAFALAKPLGVKI